MAVFLTVDRRTRSNMLKTHQKKQDPHENDDAGLDGPAFDALSV